MRFNYHSVLKNINAKVSMVKEVTG